MNPQSFWKTWHFKISQTCIFKAGFAEVCIKYIQSGWLLKSRTTDQSTNDLIVEEIN